MREVVLDTETTGFDPADGHRVVEVGCVELLDHFPTGRTLQFYLNPEREVPIESERIHGLTTAFLSDKPRFSEVADELLAFLGDAALVIHNAGFDLRFLNAEFARTGHPPLAFDRAIDTIEIAKRKIPGARYSLDELCKRFAIDLSARTRHGALLDADLTAQVYLELVGGRQKGLMLAPVDRAAEPQCEARAPARTAKLASSLTEAEREAHDAFVAAELGPRPIWSA